MVGVGLGARHGVLFRHATALEHAGRLTVLAVDKTGTLTEGRPQLTEVIALAADNREQALALAASLEAGSEHPLAAAILRAAQDAQLGLQPVEAFSVSVGQGVSGVIHGRALRLGVPAWVSPTLAEHPQVTRLTEAVATRWRRWRMKARSWRCWRYPTPSARPPRPPSPGCAPWAWKCIC